MIPRCRKWPILPRYISTSLRASAGADLEKKALRRNDKEREGKEEKSGSGGKWVEGENKGRESEETF